MIRSVTSLPVWTVATLVSATLLAFVIGTVTTVWTVPREFALMVASLFLVQAVIFQRVGSRTRHENGVQSLTLATVLTIVRGTAVVVLAGYVVLEPPTGLRAWLPALLFGLAALLDGLDGVLARATGTVSPFGERLDAEMDALMLFVGVVVTVRFGFVPFFYLVVGLARYLFVGAIFLRRLRGKPVCDLPPRNSRRILGATQMVVVFVALAPAVGATLSWWLATLAMIPFLGGFLRDWLLVSGRL